MTNPNKEKELFLEKFLKELDSHVFVKSTNSVTLEEEESSPTIEDREAIIYISGEWDREDLKDILYNLFIERMNLQDRRVVEFNGETHVYVGEKPRQITLHFTDSVYKFDVSQDNQSEDGKIKT